MKQAKLYVTNASNVTVMQLANLTMDQPEFIKIISFDNFLKQHAITNSDPMASFYQFYCDLRAKKDLFGPLKDQCESPEFAKNVFNFLCDCQQFNVDLTTLDNSNSLNNQLKALLIEMNHKRYISDYKSFNLNDTEFQLFNYDSLLCARFAQEHHINLITNTTPQKPTIIESLNLNESIMHIAQTIITNQLNVNDVLIISADSSYQTSIATVLSSFSIPSTVTIDDHIAYYQQLINHYLTFLNDSSLPNLIQLLLSGYRCDFDNIHQLIQYGHYYKDDHQIPLMPSDLFQKGDVENFNQTYQLLIECYHHQLADTYTSNYQRIVAVIDYLVKKESCYDLATKIANILAIISEDIETESGYQFFIYQLNQLSSYNVSLPIDSLLITSMDAPVSPRKYSFIVGLNNQNYPGFKAMNGLFDETFIRNSNYPSATYRQELTTTNLKWIFNSGQHITIALSQNNFDGKANEYPLFINKKEIIKVPALHQVDYPIMDTHLTNQKCIVAPNGIINGSVSSLEMYRHCAFQYFLKNILKLYPPQDLFAINSIGSIVHGVLHQLFIHQDQSKESVIEHTLAQYHTQLTPLFTQRENELNVLMKRLNETITNVWTQLDNDDSLMHQVDGEYVINAPLGPFMMKAIVDRIDEDNQGYFSIIDYKSSNHTLSIDKICQGVQLQLITYAYLLDKQRISQLKDLKYLNFFLTNDKYNPYKLGAKKSSVQPLDEVNIPKYAYKGYINEKISRKSICNDDLLALVEPIYEKLYEQLTTLSFDINPDKDACTFCQFQCICHYKGSGKDKEALIPSPFETEVSDDEME